MVIIMSGREIYVLGSRYIYHGWNTRRNTGVQETSVDPNMFNRTNYDRSEVAMRVQDIWTTYFANAALATAVFGRSCGTNLSPLLGLTTVLIFFNGCSPISYPNDAKKKKPQIYLFNFLNHI